MKKKYSNVSTEYLYHLNPNTEVIARALYAASVTAMASNHLNENLDEFLF